MFDLSLNSNFSVHLDERNDLATVTGREAFEQSVVISLTELMYDELSVAAAGPSFRQKIRMVVTRTARDHDLIEDVAELDISEKDGEPDTYEVQIVYASDETFSTELTA